MNSYKVESQYTNCSVYKTTINGVTRYDRLSDGYIKTTRRCEQLKAVHHKYDIIFLKKINSTYKLDALTYEGDKKVRYSALSAM